MDLKAFTVSDMARDIRHDHKFSFARYGDGEWASILGVKGMNCDGHYYFPRMGWDLTHTITYPESYRYGLVRIAKKVYKDKIPIYCKKQGISIAWYEGTGTVDACRDGKLFPLIDALRDKSMLYVGPEHLWVMDEILGFNIVGFVTVADTNCYLSILEIITMILEDYEEFEPDIIGFSSGPPTKIMIHKLYRTFGKDVTMIDFGSLWDGFCGKPSRRYQKTKYWEELKDVNLGVADGS